MDVVFLVFSCFPILRSSSFIRQIIADTRGIVGNKISIPKIDRQIDSDSWFKRL